MGKTKMQTEHREKGISTSRIISNVSIFFDWLSIQHIPFDEYNNFRHFKVTYKDTQMILLLLTLKRFHTSFGGLEQQLKSYLFKLFWIKLCSQYLLQCVMCYLLRYYKQQVQLVGLFFKKAALEFVVKILDKYNNKEILKNSFLKLNFFTDIFQGFW